MSLEPDETLARVGRSYTLPQRAVRVWVGTQFAKVGSVKPEIKNLPPEKLIAQLKGQARELLVIKEAEKKLLAKRQDFQSRFGYMALWATDDKHAQFRIPLGNYLAMYPEAKPTLVSWSENDADNPGNLKWYSQMIYPPQFCGEIYPGGGKTFEVAAASGHVSISIPTVPIMADVLRDALRVLMQYESLQLAESGLIKRINSIIGQ